MRRPFLFPSLPFSAQPDCLIMVYPARVARPGRRMQRVCMSTLVHYYRTVRERVVRPRRKLRRVSRGTPVHYNETVRGRVARPGWRMRRVCTGTPVHYEHTVGLSLEWTGCKALTRGGLAYPGTLTTCSGDETEIYWDDIDLIISWVLAVLAVRLMSIISWVLAVRLMSIDLRDRVGQCSPCEHGAHER